MEDSNRGERDFFRAPASLQLRYGPDTPAGRQAMVMDKELWRMQSELEDQASQTLDDSEVPDGIRPLVSVIKWLDFKLDMILHLLRQRDEGHHFPHGARTSDISGSGVGIVDGEQLTEGQSLLIALAMPDRPSRPVYAVAKVVRRDDTGADGKRTVGLAFEEISDTDRERIIRFTFQQQRRDLARRMQEKED